MLDHSADEVQIAFPNYTVSLSSTPVVRAVRALLPHLEVGAERDSVVEEVASATSLEPDFVRYVVKILESSRCLYGSGKENELLDRRASFDALLGDDVAETHRRLAETKVLVIGASGIEQAGNAVADAGLSVDVVELEPGTTIEKASSLVGAALDAGPDLAIAWGFPYRLPFARMLNDVALERRARVLFGVCEGIVGRVGPYVMPGNTACLECANLRFLANAGGPELKAVSAHRVTLGDRLPDPWPAHPLFEGAVARFLALEAAQIAGGLPPSTIDAILEYSYPQGFVERRPVLRVPRCPSCRPRRPQRLAWDVRFGASEIKKVPE